MWNVWGRLRPNLPIPEEVQSGGYGGLVKFVCAVLEIKCTPLRDAMSGRRRVEDIPSPKGGWCNTVANETVRGPLSILDVYS